MIRLCAFADEASSSLSGQISALKRNNIHLLELRSIDKINVSNFTLEQAREYAHILDDNGIGVWSIGSPLGKVDISTDFQEYLQVVDRVGEIATIFGADKIRAFSFYHAYEERERVFDYMNQMAEVVGKYGVSLYHENEKDIYGDTLERVLDIMHNVKGWRYVYDPANFLQVGERADDTLSALQYKTDYFHIKDVISSSGVLVPAGEGDGKIASLVEGIRDDKTLTLEPHLRVFDAYKDIDNTHLETKYTFATNDEAFDCAVRGLKSVLHNCGYIETQGGFSK